MATGAIAVAFMGTNSVGWSGIFAAIPFILAAKYVHAQLPVKRQRKAKPVAETPDLFTQAD